MNLRFMRFPNDAELGRATVTLEGLRRALGGEITRGKNGPQVICPGPGHSLQDRSLAVAPSNTGDGFVTHSFAGDDPVACKDYVRDKVGLPPFRPNNGKSLSQRKLAKTYDYTDESGKLLFQVIRYEPKGFSQRRPDGNSGWIASLEGVRRVPYRLPELIEALANGSPVFVVEGEKDCDALWDQNIPATCNPGGAGKWRDEYSEHFKGATVYVVSDNDEPGRAHARLVVESLKRSSATPRIIELPTLSEHGDISDWLKAGGTAEQLYDFADKAASNEKKPKRFVHSSASFVLGFVPPDYLIDGLLQRRFLYSLTGRTGGGKTAISLLISASVALGKAMGNYTVQSGRVLYMAGENPDDIRMRWIAMAQQTDFDIDKIDVHFIPGTFRISELVDRVRREVEILGGVALVIVDTSAAFFEGEDENSNVQLGAHARRLRGLVDLPGGPCVIANCHPVKNAAEDNLIPRGGGAFIAEVDGNLTAHIDGSIVELHWQGKFRGPDFPPLTFQLRSVTHERLKDSKGRLIPTVVANYLSPAEKEQLATAARSEENRLLTVLIENEGASYADIARVLGWSLKNGDPHKVKVERTLKKLKEHKLVSRDRDRWEVTDKGKKALK